MEIDKLIIYRPKKESLFYRLAKILSADTFEEVMEDELYGCLQELVEEGASHGFYGNLWHCFIANYIVNYENSYSIGCEIAGDRGGSISHIAGRDFAIIRNLFLLDLKKLTERFGYDVAEIVKFKCENDSRIFNQRIRDCICELSVQLEQAKSVEEFQQKIAEFYHHFGVGKFGLHKAFRINDDDQEVVPITKIAHVKLEDLVGYELQKEKLIANTEAFVYGRKANNCLLYGDAGTGKSTSIKAIVNQYYDDGLRMIEVYKHQFKDLNRVIGEIKNRNYKFIIYMDDLSFDDFEIEYKYLKAVIEGGLEKRPDNVLIYATSNRRHLVRESFKDKEEYDDMHKNDTVQEKLSLSARFGVTIYYGSPAKAEFEKIVLSLKERNDLKITDEDILKEANKWELNHGGLSGRTAQQFIDYLLGKKKRA